MTKKIILLSLVMGTMLWANGPEVHHLDRQRDGHIKKVQHPVHKKQHHSIEKNMRHTKAMRRTFKSPSEFRHAKRKHHKARKHMKHVKQIVRGRAYDAGRYRNYRRYDDRRYESHRSRGFRHYQNSWYLAYKYEKASFYDNEGFYYGYFNHRGYTFEGEFYRYDRYYTYRDRVRGKGLFTHRYFRPVVEYYSYHDDDDRGW
jgi:hypothetical protein